MSRFYAEVQGSRGLASRQGSKDSGIWGHIRGWNIGAYVRCRVGYEDTDQVYIEATSGSAGYGGSVPLATLERQSDGERHLFLSTRKYEGWVKHYAMPDLEGVYVCDNCGAAVAYYDVLAIRDLFERVEPGGVMPAGDCPGCGALVYPAETTAPESARVRRLMALLEETLEIVDEDEEARARFLYREVESGELTLDLAQRIRQALGVEVSDATE